MSKHDFSIECPHCRESFPLTEALAAPMLQAEHDKAQAEARRQMAQDRAKIEAEAKATAEAQYAEERKAAAAEAAKRDDEIEKARKAELAALKAKQEAEKAKSEVDLQVQRQVEAQRAEIATQAAQQADAAADAKLKAAQRELAAKDAQIVRERETAAAAATEREAQVEKARQAELAALKAKQESEHALRDIELQVQRQVDERSAELARKAAAEATAAAAAKLKAAQDETAAKDAKLKQAQDAELAAIRAKQEAEDAKREAELQVARKLDEERAKVREAALKERDDEHRLKVAEKDKQLAALNEQIEELRRKGSTASQQLVGEVLEQDLMAVLQEAFPADQFQRVSKGQSGADLIHTVKSVSGATCGTILWESKRTKAWQNPWLPKLREDQRAVTADLAVLASETLPSGVTTFDQIDGIWVTSLPAVVPLAAALRHGLQEVSTARRAGALAESTKDKVFDYLTTAPFRQRVTRIVEAYEEMRADLDKERKAMTSLWSKREKQLDRVLGGVTGFYGDLQGIVGNGMPALEALDLPQADDKPRLALVGSDVKPSNDATEA